MSSTFVKRSAAYLDQVYLPRLKGALDVLPAADLWWQPHPGVLAFGTILLHLEGNVRQWILSGLAGAPDRRERAAEFAHAAGKTSANLMHDLTRTVDEAAGWIRNLDPGCLEDARIIQGEQATITEAILHVVEHFSWHTGQAVWIAKARAGAGHGLAFYDDAQLNKAHNSDQQTCH